jgi:aspartate aminotransferase
MNKLNISKRVDGIVESPIRKFFPLVKKAESEGVEFIKLNVGDPDILPPSEILQGISGFSGPNVCYAPSPGMRDHISSWIKYYLDFNISVSEDNIQITQGAGEAILMSIMSVADAGDEILIFEPFYTNYKSIAQLCDVRLVAVTLKMENKYEMPTDSEIVSKISDKTKAIVLINPDTPTGKIWSESEIERIIKIASDNNLFIISDETYREIYFADKPKSLLEFESARDRAIVIDSLSKRFSVPGLRVGAIVSRNDELIASVRKIAMSRLSVNTIGQVCTNKILRDSTAYTSQIRQEYKKRSDALCRGLAKIDGVDFLPAMGAFYQIVRLPVEDSEEFVKYLVNDFRHNNKSVLVAPMEDFYITKNMGNNEIRIANVQTEKKLIEAVEILKLALENKKK